MKLPRDRGHDDVVKLLRRHGWRLAREGSKHTVMKNADGDMLTVPRHTVLKTGTLNAILKQAGISREDAVRDL